MIRNSMLLAALALVALCAAAYLDARGTATTRLDVATGGAVAPRIATDAGVLHPATGGAPEAVAALPRR
jgi:hypothetical protein